MEKSRFDFRTSAEEYSDDTMFRFSKQRNWRKQFRADDVCLYTFNGKHHSKPSKSAVFLMFFHWFGLVCVIYPSQVFSMVHLKIMDFPSSEGGGNLLSVGCLNFRVDPHAKRHASGADRMSEIKGLGVGFRKIQGRKFPSF